MSGPPHPDNQADPTTLAASGVNAAAPQWSVGAYGEDRFRQPRIAKLIAKGQFFSSRHLVALAIALVLIGGITQLGEMETNYIIVMPGSTENVSTSLEISGTIPLYPNHRGTISLVTVGTRRATPLDHFYANFRDDIEVIPTDEPRDRDSRERERRRDMEKMATSQEIAEYVALRALGYEVTFEGDGALVEDVVKGSGADGQIKTGDVITRVEGRRILANSDIASAIADKAVGDEIAVEVQRDGRPLEMSIRLSQSTDGEARPVIGVLVRTLNARLISPVDASFDSEDIGGPSAGLAFALELMDVLTPEDLTNGSNIVATGSLTTDGRVLPVGGVKEKAIAASRAQAQFLLVPRENLAEAQEGAFGTAVIAVGSVEEAIQHFDRMRGRALSRPGAAMASP